MKTMRNKISILALLLCFCLSGCATFRGLKEDIVNFPQGIKDGYQWMKDVDEKIAEYLW